MKVLISPVGNTDPRPDKRPDESGPALSTVEFTKPDMVFLLPTLDRVELGGNHTTERARRLEQEIRALFPQTEVRIRPYDLSDPSDFPQVLFETERLLREVARECSCLDSCEFSVNVTSGTPQMEASLLLAASIGTLPMTPVQSRNPAFVGPDEFRVREVAVTAWAERIAVDRARQFFDNHQFAACAQEIAFVCDWATSSASRAASMKLRSLALMYENVHHINYLEASEMLNGKGTVSGLLADIRGLHDYAPAIPPLEAQGALLRVLPQAHPKDKIKPGQHPETAEFLADVYHNAARCARINAHADCLARVWRALEGMFYVRLRERGIEPADVRASANKELSAEIVRFVHRDQDDRKVAIAFGTTLWLFEKCIDDPEYQALRRETFPCTHSTVERVMNWVRDDRNESVAGHGCLPVNGEKAEQGLRLARLLLERLVPGIDIDGHPFAPQRIAEVGKVFFDALRS